MKMCAPCDENDKGEKDVLWRGVCRDFAQSPGTSGGKSKYIPVTRDSLNENHYRGGADTVPYYLRLVPGAVCLLGKGSYWVALSPTHWE